MIVTCIGSVSDRRAVDAFGRRVFRRVTHCETLEDLCDRAAASKGAIFVTDLELWLAGGSVELARRVAERNDPLLIHVLHDLSPRACHELVSLARLGVDVRSAYRKYHDIEEQLEARLPNGIQGATDSILRALGHRIAENAEHLVTTCLVLSERRTSERVVAAALGISLKRLRSKLADAALPRFRALVATFRIAHVVYRMDVLGAPAKTAAAGAFGSVRHMENYVRKHSGHTPRQLVSNGGFTRVLNEIESWFPGATAKQEP